MYLNKAIIIGNLTRDPEAKALPSGVTVTSFSVATNRTYKDKNNAKQEQVEYHNIVTFGAQADNVAQFMRKGSKVLIEGRLQTRSWDGQDGQKKYRTEVIAERVQFGSRPSGKSDSDTQSKGTATKPSQRDDVPTIEYPEEDINPDDIPF
jgi:single-strand DNA-binding protein